MTEQRARVEAISFVRNGEASIVLEKLIMMVDERKGWVRRKSR